MILRAILCYNAHMLMFIYLVMYNMSVQIFYADVLRQILWEEWREVERSKGTRRDRDGDIRGGVRDKRGRFLAGDAVVRV